MGIAQYDPTAQGRPAWNAGRKVGVKKPLKQRQIWAIRFFLDREGRMRDRALFDLAIDSKLRGCESREIKDRKSCYRDGNPKPRDGPDKRPDVRFSSKSRQM
jgi:hypothetical protein